MKNFHSMRAVERGQVAACRALGFFGGGEHHNHLDAHAAVGRPKRAVGVVGMGLRKSVPARSKGICVRAMGLL